MDGKPGKAPCGHVGEHVIGNYVRCLIGCDDKRGAPVKAKPKSAYDVLVETWSLPPLSPPRKICPKCGKDDNPAFGCLYFSKASQQWHCLEGWGGCGHVWS